jgi:spore germination protein
MTKPDVLQRRPRVNQGIECHAHMQRLNVRGRLVYRIGVRRPNTRGHMNPSRVPASRTWSGLAAVSVLCVLTARASANDVAREISGYYNDGWNAESHGTYMAQSYIFSEINPYWYDLGTQQAPTLTDGTLSERAYAYTPQNVLDAHANGDLVVPVIADHALGQIDAILNDPSARQALLNNLVDTVVNRDYDGIDLNFESGTAAARAPFTAFTHDLAAALHAAGARLVVTVSAVTGFSAESATLFDYAGLAASGVDRIRIMAYDHNFDAGVNTPGPIAPIQWIRDVLHYAITTRGVASGLIQVALHNYAWTWKKSGNKWQLQTPHDTYQSVMQKSSGVGWQWDPVSAESWKQYAYAGKTYLSYVGTSDTVAARIGLADEFDLAGSSFWVLGREDQSSYARICTYFGSSCMPEPVLLSQGKPAAASSTYAAAYAAPKALDGSWLAGWLAAPSQATAWLSVDLQAVHSLTQVKVQWGAYDWSLAYDVQASNDGINWTTIDHEASNPDGGLDIIPLTGVAARYVRVSCTGPKSDNWSYEIYELQVFGMP